MAETVRDLLEEERLRNNPASWVSEMAGRITRLEAQYGVKATQSAEVDKRITALAVLNSPPHPTDGQIGAALREAAMKVLTAYLS